MEKNNNKKSHKKNLQRLHEQEIREMNKLDFLQEVQDTDEEDEIGIQIVNSHYDKLKEIREERLKGNQEKNEDKKEEVRYKIKPLLVGFIIVLIILMIYIVFEYGPLFGININKNGGILEDSTISIVTSENDIYQMYNQELLIYSNNAVSTYNQYCQKTWEYDLEDTFTPNIYIYNRYMVIANNTNGTIYMFENKKELFNKKIDGTIQNIYIDEQGNIAIEYSTTGYKKVIGVYDKSGKSKFDTYLSSNTLVNLKMIENCKKLLIVQANSNSFKIGMDISIVDSTRETDNITEICTIDNSMLYDIRVEGQNAFMLLDNRMIKMDLNNGNMTDIKTFDNNQLLFAIIGVDYYTCLEKKLNQEKDDYVLSMIQYNGVPISEYPLENTPKVLYNSGILNYMIYQDSLQVINKWGIEIKRVPIEVFPKEIVVFNNEKSIGLIYTNKIYIINM